MNHIKLNAFSCHAGKAGLAALVVAASITVASTQAMAAPTCFTTPIAVPVTTSGIYLNLFTGVSATTPAGAPGWDFNPWGSSAASFWVAATTPLSGFVDSGSGTIGNLTNGTPVGPASTFLTGNSSAATMALWRAGIANGNLGMRFVEAGSTYYAWINMTSVGTTGVPLTINSWCFESTPDTAINVGSTPVSLQKFTID
ncbi:MAG: hypothetical protein IPF61_00910 [Xanthomonadales bacterium]|nr:hypothetical protein [Xanthomonadales bacterium]